MCLNNPLHIIFGYYYPLVVHVGRATAAYIVILGPIYLAKTIVPSLFPPGEYISLILHAVDAYA